jgi:hypothetical protein
VLRVEGIEETTILAVNRFPGEREAVRGVGNVGVRGISRDTVGVAAGVVGNGNTGVFGVGNIYGVKGLVSGANVPDNRVEHAGVVGSAATSFGVGVMGIGAGFPGVLGSSPTDPGVQGTSTSGAGVYGNSFESVGVRGEGRTNGVIAFSARGTGIQASGPDHAGFFIGHVTVFRGDFTVIDGAKSAAVRHPDGYHRRLYSVESPESWFEDFGEAQLIDGRAKVDLDSDFASITRTETYHVFLTASGDSNGLYVTNKTAKAFEVREQHSGKSSVPFSYRIVAKRKDIAGERLAKVSLPPISPELEGPETA